MGDGDDRGGRNVEGVSTEQERPRSRERVEGVTYTVYRNIDKQVFRQRICRRNSSP